MSINIKTQVKKEVLVQAERETHDSAQKKEGGTTGVTMAVAAKRLSEFPSYHSESPSLFDPLTLSAPAAPASPEAATPTAPVFVPPLTGMQAIPSDVFRIILSFLDTREITRLHKVSKNLGHLPIDKNGHLDLSGPTNLSDSDLEKILDDASARGYRIKSINLSWCRRLTNAALADLSNRNLTSLTSLNLEGCRNITNASLAHLSKLTSLTSLSLRGCDKITDAGLDDLLQLKSLTSFDLSGCYRITDTGLYSLSKFTLLSSLNLRWCSKITDVGLNYLSTLSDLSSLNLGWCEEITDACVDDLSKLKLLRSLQLDNSGVTLDTAKAFTEKLSIQRS